MSSGILRIRLTTGEEYEVPEENGKAAFMALSKRGLKFTAQQARGDMTVGEPEVIKSGGRGVVELPEQVITAGARDVVELPEQVITPRTRLSEPAETAWDALGGFLHGASGGLGDDALDAIGKRGDIAREQWAQSQARSPTGFAVGDVVGSMAMPLGRVTKAAGVIPKLANAAYQGGVQAAMRGYGESEHEEPMLRAWDALAAGAKGAAESAMISGGLTAAGAAARGVGRAIAGAEPWFGRHADANRLRTVLPKQMIDDMRLSKGADAIARYASELEQPRAAIGGKAISGGLMATPDAAAARAATVGADAGRRIAELEDELGSRFPGGGPPVDYGPIAASLQQEAAAVGQRGMPMARSTHAPYLRSTAEALLDTPRYDAPPDWLTARAVGAVDDAAPHRVHLDQALKDRRYYDKAIGSGFNRPAGQLSVQDLVDRGVANDLRGAISRGISESAPEMAQPWESAMRDSHVANLVVDPATRVASRFGGASPMGVRDMVRAAGLVGNPGMGAASLAGSAAAPMAHSSVSAVQRGLGKASGAVGQAGQDVGGKLQQLGASRLPGAIAAAQQGDAKAPDRLPSAIAEALRSDPSALGPYAQPLAAAMASPNPGAVNALVEQLTRQDRRFAEEILPKLYWGL